MKDQIDAPALSVRPGKSATAVLAAFGRRWFGFGTGAQGALTDLARVVHEVIAAPTLEQALTTVVHHVRQSMAVDVCEVYLADRDACQYVLLAGTGLPQRLIGKVRFDYGEGLIGRVAEQVGPISLNQADTHPDYVFNKKTGQAGFPGFLGVPLTHQGLVLGVLVVRQRRRRSFRQEDEAFLVTLAAQVAGAVAYAQAVSVPGSFDVQGCSGARLAGQPGAPGVAVGTAVVMFHPAVLEEVPDRVADDIEAERVAFLTALAQTVEGLSQTSVALESTGAPAFVTLLDAYRLMLQSDEFQAPILARIQTGNWAPAALREAIDEHCRHFAAMDDPYLCERSSDLRGLGQRLLLQLMGGRPAPEYPVRTLLVGEHISAMDVAEVPPDRLVGIVCAQGSKLSHVAILAHARGVPAVMGLGEAPLEPLDGRNLALDGYLGRVYVEPGGKVLKEFERIQRTEQELNEELARWSDCPAETPDGLRVSLGVNVASPAEAELGRGAGADKVGLFRTEFPFMLHDRFPSEDEQCQVYRQVLEAFAPGEVTIRTLDAGGDKALPYLAVHEDNPFLGWRGIRMTLDHPEVFAGQVRAVLRAGRGLGGVRLLLPMVSGLEELETALDLFGRTFDRFVVEEGATPRPLIGAMIEVPSAVYQAEAIARRVDFLSVGTNDLTQYLIAVDRTNPRVAKLLEPFHPAVLHALRDVAIAARAAGRPVSCCGELAGDPAAIPFLLGVGFDELSMSVGALPRIRWVVRNISGDRMRDLSEQVLCCDRAETVRRLLTDALEEAGLAGLVRAGK